MRIAIMGAGATGGYFGALLARAGEEVVFIARGDHLAAMRRSGLRVESTRSGEFTVPVVASDDPGAVGPVDLVLFCVKSYDTEAAAEAIRPLVGPTTAIVTIQNGVDNAERLARRYGPDAVLGGLAFIESTIAAPGVIAHLSPFGRIIFGELAGGISERVKRLEQHLRAAGVDAQASANMTVALWEKFLFITPLAGLTSLTRLPIGPLRECPETWALYGQCTAEVWGMGRAAGVALPDDAVERNLANTRQVAASFKSSMQRDLERGKRLELEALNGYVVRRGAELGVPTPVNSVIYGALKPHVDGPPEPG